MAKKSEKVTKFTSVFHADTKRKAEKILSKVHEDQEMIEWVKTQEYMGKMPDGKYRVVVKYKK